MSKKSITGLINQQHEVHRLENLFYKVVGSAYYLEDYGLDWGFFNNPKIEISTDSFLNYLVQEASKNGIICTEITSEVKDFTLNVRVKLLSEDVVYLSSGV